MFYYIRTCKKGEYELSEKLKTKEEAEEKLSHMHKKNRERSNIVCVPDIRIGLMLYAKGEYYKTIVDSTDTLWLVKKDINEDCISDPILKDSLISMYFNEIIDGVEKYNPEIKSEV